MEKETKKFVAGTITGVAIGIGGILLVMKLGENYRLVNPFVRIQEETIDNEETERDLPSWRYSDSIGNTTQTDEETERTTEERTGANEDKPANTATSSTSTETSTIASSTSTETSTITSSTSTETSTVTSSTSTETTAYALTDEELLALFPPIIQDNSGNVIATYSETISENNTQAVTSMTSSISGGEVISYTEEITYEEVGPTR